MSTYTNKTYVAFDADNDIRVAGRSLGCGTFLGLRDVP